MKITANTICASLLLVSGIILLQAHALPLWQGLMGEQLGILCSFTLEGIALWLMFQPGKTARIGGLMVAVAILIAPLWQVGAPTWHKAQAAYATTLYLDESKKLQQQALADAIKDKVRYQSIAGARIGWQGKISEAEAREAKARKALELLHAQNPTSPWAVALPLLAVIAALLVFQLTNLLTVRVLRKACHNLPRSATVPHVAATTPVATPMPQPATKPQLATVPHVAATKPVAGPLPQPATIMGVDVFSMRNVTQWLEDCHKKIGTWKAVGLKLGVAREEICHYIAEVKGTPHARVASPNAKQSLFLAFEKANSSHAQSAD